VGLGSAIRCTGTTAQLASDRLITVRRILIRAFARARAVGAFDFSGATTRALMFRAKASEATSGNANFAVLIRTAVR